jgi:hypothetical protein
MDRRLPDREASVPELWADPKPQRTAGYSNSAEANTSQGEGLQGSSNWWYDRVRGAGRPHWLHRRRRWAQPPHAAAPHSQHAESVAEQPAEPLLPPPDPWLLDEGGGDAHEPTGSGGFAAGSRGDVELQVLLDEGELTEHHEYCDLGAVQARAGAAGLRVLQWALRLERALMAARWRVSSRA